MLRGWLDFAPTGDWSQVSTTLMHLVALSGFVIIRCSLRCERTTYARPRRRPARRCACHGKERSQTAGSSEATPRSASAPLPPPSEPLRRYLVHLRSYTFGCRRSPSQIETPTPVPSGTFLLSSEINVDQPARRHRCTTSRREVLHRRRAHRAVDNRTENQRNIPRSLASSSSTASTTTTASCLPRIRCGATRTTSTRVATG